MTHRITGFSDFVHRPDSKYELEEKHDISETGSVSALRWGETPTLLGPLERANLDHWTTHVRNTELYKHLRPDWVNEREREDLYDVTDGHGYSTDGASGRHCFH
jgi:hypothetical protein